MANDIYESYSDHQKIYVSSPGPQTKCVHEGPERLEARHLAGIVAHLQRMRGVGDDLDSSFRRSSDDIARALKLRTHVVASSHERFRLRDGIGYAAVQAVKGEDILHVDEFAVHPKVVLAGARKLERDPQAYLRSTQHRVIKAVLKSMLDTEAEVRDIVEVVSRDPSEGGTYSLRALSFEGPSEGLFVAERRIVLQRIADEGDLRLISRDAV
jgi:hypothetical protein